MATLNAIFAAIDRLAPHFLSDLGEFAPSGVLGFLCALVFGTLAWIAIGLKLRLYLVSFDSLVRDQSIIPITAELKRTSIFETLRSRSWVEDVEVTLRDYSDRRYLLRFGFQIFRRYHVTALGGAPGEKSTIVLDGRALIYGKPKFVRTGMVLTTGDRDFKILVSPMPPAADSGEEKALPSSLVRPAHGLLAGELR